MENVSKNNEELHGAFMAPMMFMSSSHSFTPCTNSNYHLEGHDITLSPKLTADSNGDGKVEREDHECLGDEKTYIRLISNNGKSPYSHMFEYQ